MERVTALAPYVATLTSLMLGLSPMGPIRQAIARRSVGTMAFFPLMAMYYNNLANCIFGLNINDRFVMGVASWNGMLCMFYILAFVCVASEKRAALRALVVSHILVLTAYAWIATLEPERASFNLGMMANVAGVVMFGSPLVAVVRACVCEFIAMRTTACHVISRPTNTPPFLTLTRHSHPPTHHPAFLFRQREVLRTQSSSPLPLGMCITGFICSGTWTAYGMQLGNLFVIVPNAAGFALSCLQLLLIFVYPPTAPETAKGGPHEL